MERVSPGVIGEGRPITLLPRGRDALALALVVLLGAALRLWNHDFDAGTDFIHDAIDKIGQAQAVAGGDLRPQNWRQPYFLPYTAGAVLAVVSAVMPLDQVAIERTIILYMIALSLATIVLTDVAAMLAFEDRTVAVVAAAIMAVAPVSVIGSRYIKEDVPLAFCCQVALVAILLVFRAGRRRHYVAAALAIGLAAGTKLSALLLVPVFAGAHLLRHRASGRPLRALASPWCLAMAALIAVGFLVVNPYALSNAARIVAGVTFQSRYAGRGHHDGTVVDPWAELWTFYLRQALVPGLSLAVTLAFLLGVVALARRLRQGRDQAAVPLLLWLALGYLLFERSPAKPFPFFARYFHPFIPAVAIIAAWALAMARREVWRRAGRGALWATNVALGAVIAWPLARSALISAGISDDTRVQAARWMTEHLPRGSTVALDDRRYSPPLDQSPFTRGAFQIIAPSRLVDDPIAESLAERVDYVVLNSIRMDRYALTRSRSPAAQRAYEYYRRLREELPVVKEFRPRFALQSYAFHNPVVTIHRTSRRVTRTLPEPGPLDTTRTLTRSGTNPRSPQQ